MRFILFDKIVELNRDKSIVGIKNMSNEFAIEFFPKKQMIPNTLIIETLAQCVSWLIEYSIRFEYGLVLGLVENAVFYRHVFPGDQLVIKGYLDQISDNGSVVHGGIYCGNNAVLECERIVYVHSKKYIDIEREEQMKRFYYLANSGHIFE